jgi:hypothetical protein
MDGCKVYMAEHKVHVFDFSLSEGWVVMAGPKVYMAEPKVTHLNLSKMCVQNCS